MDAEFVDLTAENLADEHLCCIIRTKKAHPGVEAKRRWLSDRLREGHVFRKQNAKGVVFIEYAPLETAWVPVTGDNYYYIYCLWVAGPYKGKGYAKALMEHCLADARTHGKSGVCMLGAEKQKAWLSDQSFARKFGFEIVDTTDNGYELLALSFDGTTPQFAHNAKKQRIIVSEYPFEESSKIINILTKDGEYNIIAKGAKKIKSPFFAVTNKFTLGIFNIQYKEKGLSKLIDADIINNYSTIKKDINIY